MPCDNIKATSEIENVDWSTGTGSGHHYANVRFGSGSSQASQSSGDICRICHCESDPQNPLLTPCYCSGSLKYVHQTCLQQWLTASETNSCELCKFPFIMHTKIKPFNEWRSLDISGIERRRLCCSVLFHCAAALCVIWSLCVLIERAADDVKRGRIDWPFWTKLAVVTVGLTGGVVFMYIQCKAYLHLCHRWKARNRILLIQNAPEKIHPLSPPSPATNHRSRHSGSHEPIRVSAAGIVGGNLEIGTNAAASSNAFNYANSITGLGGRNVETDGAAAHHLLPSSPHHMLQQGDLDIDALTSHSSNGIHHLLHHQQSYHFPPQQQVGQVAVSANIECSQSQHNYERDWALDDVVSQISSFRPCPQGSGSMTPFHDSIHNVLENSESSSRISVNDVCGGSRQDLSTGCVSSDTGREHCLQLSSYSGSEHKAPSIGSGVSNAVANGLGGFAYKPHGKRYSNSSIFLENRDILNDSVDLNLETSDFPKISYRHSSILTPPEGENEQLEQFLSKDLRRYSDTKLLDSADATTLTATGDLMSGNMDSATRERLRQLFRLQSTAANDTVIDVEKEQLPTSLLLESHADAATAAVSKDYPLRRSLHTVNGDNAAVLPPTNSSLEAALGPIVTDGRGTTLSAVQQGDKTRLFFKSLPNLSSSCESLIKK